MASPFPFTSGQVLTAAQLNGIGDYTDYSGTVAFTNFTLGNGTVNEARYAQVNDFVHYYGRVTLGSTSAVSGTIGVSVPVNIGPSGQPPWGFSRFLKSGVGWWIGSVDQSSQTRINLHSLNATYTYLVDLGGTSATIPFTWTPTSDQFLWNVFYKAA